MANTVIAKTFSVSAREIERLRSVHRTFDEACRDFEELFAIKTSASKDGDVWASEQAGESLEEVRLEIERKLRDFNAHQHSTKTKANMGENH